MDKLLYSFQQLPILKQDRAKATTLIEDKKPKAFRNELR